MNIFLNCTDIILHLLNKQILWISVKIAELNSKNKGLSRSCMKIFNKYVIFAIMRTETEI